MTEAHYGGPRALILMSLFGGPKHGYAIIEDVADVCGVGLGPGTLYGALTSLEQQGLIEALPAQGRRRPCRLTPAGRDAADEQAQAWSRLAAAMSTRREARPASGGVTPKPRLQPRPAHGGA